MKIFTEDRWPLWDIAVSFSRDGVIAFDILATNAQDIMGSARNHLREVCSDNVRIEQTFAKDEKHGYAYILYDANRCSEAEAITQLRAIK